MNEELNVKVGDEVFVVGKWGTELTKLTKVKRVTPTGIIKVECNQLQYDKYGIEKTSDIWRPRTILEKATVENREKI